MPVPAPTNPKKKSLMPSSPLRRKLRAAGHHLSAVVQVGKDGVTDAVVRQLEEALLAHELVKVKVGTETPEDRFEAAEALGARTDAQLAQILGRTVLVYRRHPEHPRFEAAPAASERAPKRAGTKRGAAAPAGRRASAAKRASGPRRRGGAPAARRTGRGSSPR